MSAVLISSPRIQLVDENGAPLVGAKLYTLGTGTSTQVPTYTTPALSAAHSNPLTSNAGGFFPAIYPDPSLGALKFRFFSVDSDGNEVNLGIDTDPAYTPLALDDLNTTSSDLAQFLNSFKRTDAEIASGIFPTDYSYSPSPYDVRRIGVLPNQPAASTTATAALVALLNPSVAGVTGPVVFPNTSGSDVYYVNGVIPVRDGVRIDLCGSTINYTATGTANDSNSGCFFALHDFACENGSFDITWATGISSSGGNAIQIGARSNDSSYFTVYDSLLETRMGNITLRNLRITTSVTGVNIASTAAIAILGGVENLTIQNVVIDGQGVLQQAITSEFGWATNESSASARQTSHGRNWNIGNIDIQNMDAAVGRGLVLAGVYNVTVDGLAMTGGASICTITTGEALNYRPWSGVDTGGIKRNIILRNIVGQGLVDTGIAVSGAQAATGYLSTVIGALGSPSDYIAQTDLLNVVIESFAINTSSGGYGIQCSAGSVDIRNGKVRGAQRGVVLSNECTTFFISNVDVRGCTQYGMQLGLDSNIWSPKRQKIGVIQLCRIVGNGTSASGSTTYAGVLIDNSQSVLVTRNRIGYDTVEDGQTETTQGNGVELGSAAAGVVCDGNLVGSIFAGSGTAFGYSSANSTADAGNTVTNGTGVITTSGNWSTDFSSGSAATIAGAGTITIQSLSVVRVTTAGAVTGVILQAGYRSGQRVTIVHEGSAANTITFAASGTSHVANGTGNVIAGLTARTFIWDGGTSLWYPVQ